MAATLRDTLLAPEVRPQVVADCEALVNGEVATMPGISGTAVKLAYMAALPAVGAMVERYTFLDLMSFGDISV
jgi:hypothetical protein